MTKAHWEKFLILLGLVVYLLMFPHGIHGDAYVRYLALNKFLSTGELMPMVYSYVHPLVSSLLLLPAKIIKDEGWWMTRFNTFVFFGALFYYGRSLARYFNWTASEVRLAILLLMGATMMPKHTTDYYAEVFGACLALAAIFLYLRGRWHLAILALCLSTWNVIATLVGASLLLVLFALRSKQWRYLVAIPLLALGFLVENYLKFGELYPSVYIGLTGPKTMMPYASGPGFSYPIFFGLLNTFFSFGRGLLFFAPGLLFLFHPSIWRDRGKEREFFLLGVAYFIGITIVYSKYWAWHAGAFWGPRYMLFASLFAALLLAWAWIKAELTTPWRILWVGCVLLSIWVGCQGVMWGTDFLEDCYSQGHQLEHVCFYVPQYSVLWRPFIVWPPLVGRRVGFLAFFLLVAITLLAPPVRVLLSIGWKKAKDLWKAYQPFSGWRM